MSPTTTWTHRWASTALALLLWSPTIAAAPSIPLTYCASVNTASTNANHSIYQSDGLCHDFCKDGSYPLAIVQDDTCWCSSKVPDKKSQVSLSQCSTPCPGFPDDLCGGNGLYGYVVVDGVPGSKPTAPGGPGQSSGPTPPPTPTVQTVTAGGTVMTVTVTPTSGVNSPNQAAVTSQNSGGLGVGASVGIAIGVIAAAVLAAVAAFCVWRRRKQRQDEGKGIFHTPSPRGSSAGMTGSPKVAEKSTTPPFLSRNPDGTYESDHSGRRRSFLMPIDPRIDPAHTAIYNRDGNKSHESVNTLRDDQDYSRRVHQPKVLRATNPDPDDD